MLLYKSSTGKKLNVELFRVEYDDGSPADIEVVLGSVNWREPEADFDWGRFIDSSEGHKTQLTSKPE